MDPYRLYQLRRKLYPMFPIFCANEEASSICVCRGGLGSASAERLRESYLTCLWSRAGWTPERLACCEVGIDKVDCRECEEILNWYSSSNVVGTVSHVVERGCSANSIRASIAVGSLAVNIRIRNKCYI
mmetsp:Transcript_18466/g.15758  ORF Transcript_18466/g.15758 Transcript_18466/m.15758 type:complete len:129 (-) Transcript_18466:61-447(-)